MREWPRSNGGSKRLRRWLEMAQDLSPVALNGFRIGKDSKQRLGYQYPKISFVFLVDDCWPLTHVLGVGGIGVTYYIQ